VGYKGEPAALEVVEVRDSLRPRADRALALDRRARKRDPGVQAGRNPDHRALRGRGQALGASSTIDGKSAELPRGFRPGVVKASPASVVVSSVSRKTAQASWRALPTKYAAAVRPPSSWVALPPHDAIAQALYEASKSGPRRGSALNPLYAQTIPTRVAPTAIDAVSVPLLRQATKPRYLRKPNVYANKKASRVQDPRGDPPLGRGAASESVKKSPFSRPVPSVRVVIGAVFVPRNESPIYDTTTSTSRSAIISFLANGLGGLFDGYHVLYPKVPR